MYKTIVSKDDHWRVIGKGHAVANNARRKGSTPPTLPIREQRIDTSNVLPRVDGRLKNGEPKVNVAVGGRGDWPLDALVKIEVDRMIGVWRNDLAGPAEGLMGHRIVFDFFTKETNVTIKSYNDPHGIVIFVNGKPVHEWWQFPGDLPTKEMYREYINKMDGMWASFVDLQPGDEVIEGENGIEIVRAPRCHRCGCALAGEASDFMPDGPWEPICDECHDLTMVEKEYGVEAVVAAIEAHGEHWRDFIGDVEDDPVLEDDDEILEDDDGEIDWE